MNIRFIGAAIFSATMMAASPAISATLSITSGGVAETLPVNFNPTPSVSEPALGGVLGTGLGVTTFEASTDGGSIGGGLQIDPLGSSGNIRVTFLGKEAGNQNTASMDLIGSTGTLNNKTSSAGDFIQFKDDGGFVDFLFRNVNQGKQIENGGTGEFAAAPLSMSFSSVFDGAYGDAVIAFFGDGFGDNDFDDMVVRIEIIPLPAGILLLLTALGGLVFVGRRRQMAA